MMGMGRAALDADIEWQQVMMANQVKIMDEQQRQFSITTALNQACHEAIALREELLNEIMAR